MKGMESHQQDFILTHHLAKSFGTRAVLKDVNFSVRQGTVHALVGPNGAGKTTLIKLLVGLYVPTHGHVEICGVDVSKHPLEAKRRFGYISDDPVAYGYLSGLEFLLLTARLREMEMGSIEHRIKELIEIFPIQDIIHQPMTQYSRGNRQKLAFLAAMLTKPEVLIIDEPIVGLDPTSIEVFGKTLRVYVHDGGAVLFSTHILDFAKEYAHHVTLMKQGSIIADEKITLHTNLEHLYQKTQ